jgi:4'-phosphopantetheinyl transferase
MAAMEQPQLRWDLPPDDWRLSEADVHVWSASLDVPLERLSSYEQTLSWDERSRAARFKFDHHRKRFIVGRGILRAILGSYVEVEPVELQLDHSLLGKPSLAGFPQKLHFSLSHSRNMLLIAVTGISAIGVDVELIQSVADIESVARHFFSADEARRLMDLPEEERALAFYKVFVRKEAYLKARGAGLSSMIRQIEVSFAPDEPTRIRSICGDTQAAACWTLMELAPASGFTGAVAAEAKNLRFLLWQWSR